MVFGSSELWTFVQKLQLHLRKTAVVQLIDIRPTTFSSEHAKTCVADRRLGVKLKVEQETVSLGCDCFMNSINKNASKMSLNVLVGSQLP